MGILEFVAIEVDAQRLQLGDVILIDLPGQETKIEAQVVGHSPEVTREIERSESTVRATLRVPGRDDFVMESPLDRTSRSFAVLEPDPPSR